MSGSSVSTRARCPSGCAPTDQAARSAPSTSRVPSSLGAFYTMFCPRFQADPALWSVVACPKEERAGRCPCRARCAATTTQSHRVGGRVPAPGGAHRTGPLPALRYRTVSCVGGDLAGTSSADAKGAAVRWVGGANISPCRSDGKSVSGGACTLAVRPRPWRRARRTGYPEFSESGSLGPPCSGYSPANRYAKRLTSPVPSLQSP